MGKTKLSKIAEAGLRKGHHTWLGLVLLALACSGVLPSLLFAAAAACFALWILLFIPKQRWPKARKRKAIQRQAAGAAAEKLTARFRTDKRRQRQLAMEDWDREWTNLLDPKSADTPAEAASPAPAQHQSAKRLFSNAHSSTGDSPAPPKEVRTQADPHRPRSPRTPPAKTDYAQPGEPAGPDAANGLLAGDPRTMWAWAEYVDGRLNLPVTYEDARQILAATPPGDHVEVFGAMVVSNYHHNVGIDNPRQRHELQREAFFAARTFDWWILPTMRGQAMTIPASKTRHGFGFTGHYPDIKEHDFSVAGGLEIRAYADERLADRFLWGAGKDILRLPDSPLAPAPPDLDTRDFASVKGYVDSVTERIRKAQANYGSIWSWQALDKMHGVDRSHRAHEYLKGAEDAIRRRSQIDVGGTRAAVISYYRNADLKAAFFCQVLGLPYPGDAPIAQPPPPPKRPADFY